MIVAKTKMKKIPESCSECDFCKNLGVSWWWCEIKKAVTPYGTIVSDGWCPLMEVKNENRKKTLCNHA